jgi:3-deoxy-D-manno-octulosonate 8-phosphate phosphatase (KDO 8-P phosphatase)
MLKKILLDEIDAFIFDFDGVLTNNLVHLDESGKEWVTCSRADGLAFDVLHKLKKPVFILSTERNPVVTARAKKLKVPVIQGITNKVNAFVSLLETKGFDLNRVLYVGNDLNDYGVMQMCGYAICPADAHPRIKELAIVVLLSSGGTGVVRELLEDILELNFIEILYSERN